LPEEDANGSQLSAGWAGKKVLIGKLLVR